MKMIDHNHFICHLILGTFTEYPYLNHTHYLRMIAYNWIVVQMHKKMFCLSVAFS